MIGDFFSFWTHHRSSLYVIIYAFSLIEGFYLFISQRSDGDPHISISLPIQPYIRSGLSQFSWKHQDTIFSPAYPEPYLPFLNLSRLKRLGAGLVMFTIHADTSMKSEGGPGSAWSRRSPCLLTVLCPWCPGLSHSIRTPVGRLEARDEFNFISWPNHDGQWCSQTWTGLRSLSVVSTDEHFFHYHKTDSQVVQLHTWTQL